MSPETKESLKAISPRTPDLEEVKSMTEEIIDRLRKEMSIEMEKITDDSSLSSDEIDKGVFTILDAYQSATMTLTSFFEGIRKGMGRTTTKTIYGSGIVPSSTDGTMN